MTLPLIDDCICLCHSPGSREFSMKHVGACCRAEALTWNSLEAETGWADTTPVAYADDSQS